MADASACVTQAAVTPLPPLASPPALLLHPAVPRPTAGRLPGPQCAAAARAAACPAGPASQPAAHLDCCCPSPLQSHCCCRCHNRQRCHLLRSHKRCCLRPGCCRGTPPAAACVRRHERRAGSGGGWPATSRSAGWPAPATCAVDGTEDADRWHFMLPPCIPARQASQVLPTLQVVLRAE